MGMRSGVLKIPVGTVVTASSSSLALSGNNPMDVPYENGLPVEAFDVLSVDISVAAVAGTSISFFYDRQGMDGVWYTVYSTGPIAPGAATSFTLAGQNSASQEFGFIGRFRWTLIGTSATISASITGK